MDKILDILESLDGVEIECNYEANNKNYIHFHCTNTDSLKVILKETEEIGYVVVRNEDVRFGPGLEYVICEK